MLNTIFLFKEIFVIKIIVFYLLSSIFFILYTYGVFRHSNLVATKRIDIEKTSSYECGFNPYIQARTKFNIKFYIISIIFLIFDLEIILLLPISLLLIINLCLGVTTILVYGFLIILLLGIVIEYNAELFAGE